MAKSEAVTKSDMDELETKLLKKIEAAHRSMTEYKAITDQTLEEIRAAVTSVVRRSRVDR